MIDVSIQGCDDEWNRHRSDLVLEIVSAPDTKIEKNWRGMGGCDEFLWYL